MRVLRLLLWWVWESNPHLPCYRSKKGIVLKISVLVISCLSDQSLSENHFRGRLSSCGGCWQACCKVTQEWFGTTTKSSNCLCMRLSVCSMIGSSTQKTSSSFMRLWLRWLASTLERCSLWFRIQACVYVCAYMYVSVMCFVIIFLTLEKGFSCTVNLFFFCCLFSTPLLCCSNNHYYAVCSASNTPLLCCFFRNVSEENHYARDFEWSVLCGSFNWW